MRGKKAFIKSIFIPLDYALNTILPPRCIGTGEIVDQQGMIAPTLWQELDFIAPPYCATCGLPFDFEDSIEDTTICGDCLSEPPRFDIARAALRYNDASRRLLLRFKYGDQQHAAVTFARWLHLSGLESLKTADFILPVPLHWRRLWQRRFNQSALLAKALALRSDIPYLANALTRRRFTGPQKGLNRRNRQKNVRMAFTVTPSVKARIKGKHLILIDDVMTSGATVNECAKLLKHAGAAKITVLTVARVLREDYTAPQEIDLPEESAV
jgi:ComF family protein